MVDEAAAPSGPLPTLTGVTVKEKGSTSTRTIKARYVVVADGSNSRIGRMLGTSRRRDLPMGMALRGYYRSDRHDDPFIESHLDIRDAEGDVVPGYGWIFPMGDGRVNVGRRPALDRPALEGPQHQPSHGRLRGLRSGVVGHPARDEPRAADRREAPHGALGRAAGRRERRDHGRRQRRHQPVQRRGDRLRLRDRAGWPPPPWATP